MSKAGTRETDSKDFEGTSPTLDRIFRNRTGHARLSLTIGRQPIDTGRPSGQETRGPSRQQRRHRKREVVFAGIGTLRARTEFCETFEMTRLRQVSYVLGQPQSPGLAQEAR